MKVKEITTETVSNKTIMELHNIIFEMRDRLVDAGDEDFDLSEF